MATAGALDLKPEVFEGAFSSGVVGALTASQQVMLPSSACTFTKSCGQLNTIVPCLSVWAPHFRTTHWTFSHSCQLPSSACCTVHIELNSSPCPMLQCNSDSARLPVQLRLQLAVCCRCCLASLKTNMAPSYSQVLNLPLYHVCPCFCTNFCTSLTVTCACQTLLCLLAHCATSVLCSHSAVDKSKSLAISNVSHG